MLKNIPTELRQLPQWVVATGKLSLKDGKPDKVPLNPTTCLVANVTDPATWGSFADAEASGMLVGFVLSKDDPYTIIDLDNPETPEQEESHQEILNQFETYAEVSHSGNGVHIICRGKVLKGFRKDKVEVYSESRYMICTGNVLKDLTITDCQKQLNKLIETISPRPTTELNQINSDISDDALYETASTASNAAKFNQLWKGDWKNEYPSQSEADFALLSILCFYSKDNFQVVRMFRYSALGQRAKAQRDDYFLSPRYGAISKIRAKETTMVDLSILLSKSTPLAQSVHEIQDSLPLESEDDPLPFSNQTVFPPGFIGDAAAYILSSAIVPVPEIALVAAIGLTAGIIGRSYNISNTGLNQYIILIAETGRGKEEINRGIGRLLTAVQKTIPMASAFIGPSTFASGQALIRHLDTQSCFVSVLNEFGVTLQHLCSPSANAVHSMLKKVLLDIYVKSGHEETLQSSVYSDKERNTKIVHSPNMTLLGETNHADFYEGLDLSAISKGLIPRFSIFEYNGPVPDDNENAFHKPGDELIHQLAELITCAMASTQNRSVTKVELSEDAKVLFKTFNRKCKDEINSGQNKSVDDLWTRAHLKALKLAALVAVGENPHLPIVSEATAQWAVTVVENGIGTLKNHFLVGDIGQGDTKMEADLRRAINDWLAMKAKRRGEYQCPARCAEAPVVPLHYLRKRLRNLASFRLSKFGATMALDKTLDAMVKSGEIQLIGTMQAVSAFGVSSPLYCVGENW